MITGSSLVRGCKLWLFNLYFFFQINLLVGWGVWFCYRTLVFWPQILNLIPQNCLQMSKKDYDGSTGWSHLLFQVSNFQPMMSLWGKFSFYLCYKFIFNFLSSIQQRSKFVSLIFKESFFSSGVVIKSSGFMPKWWYSVVWKLPQQ